MTPKCHAKREHYARGLCRPCYDHERRWGRGVEAYPRQAGKRTLSIVADYEAMTPNAAMVEKYGIQWESIMRTVNRHYARQEVAA